MHTATATCILFIGLLTYEEGLVRRHRCDVLEVNRVSNGCQQLIFRTNGEIDGWFLLNSVPDKVYFRPLPSGLLILWFRYDIVYAIRCQRIRLTYTKEDPELIDRRKRGIDRPQMWRG